jgi:hypothetical protein
LEFLIESPPTTPRLSNPTRCKDLLQNITSREITPRVIILWKMAWHWHLIKHRVKYSRRRSQRIEEIDMIASLKLYGHIMLPCVPQRKPPHIPWSMGVKLKPLEVQLPSLWVAIHEEIINDEQIRLRFQELNALEEGHLQAVQNLELYHQNMVRAYDKLVKQWVFQKGELVLILRCPIVITHKTRGKFEPK